MPRLGELPAALPHHMHRAPSLFSALLTESWVELAAPCSGVV